jgi:hypothetical protein
MSIRSQGCILTTKNKLLKKLALTSKAKLFLSRNNMKDTFVYQSTFEAQ